MQSNLSIAMYKTGQISKYCKDVLKGKVCQRHLNTHIKQWTDFVHGKTELRSTIVKRYRYNSNKEKQSYNT